MILRIYRGEYPHYKATVLYFITYPLWKLVHKRRYFQYVIKRKFWPVFRWDKDMFFVYSGRNYHPYHFRKRK